MRSKRRAADTLAFAISADLDARELELLRLQIERLAREMGVQVAIWRVEDARA
ncbi:MAG: hypothetical protein ACREJY_12760 [Candidatus Rokuibacteriota bacterium]